MATFRDSSSTYSASGASYSAAKPSGTVQGDFQLAFMAADATGSNLSISGGATWAQVGSYQNITNGDTCSFSLYAQIAGAAEPANYTVTKDGGGTQNSVCLILSYSGVDVSGTIANAIAAQLATNPNSVSPPSSPVSIDASAITTTDDNQTVVWFGLVDWNVGTTAAFTDPSSTTRRAVQTPNDFSNALAVDFVKASAGSTGTVSGTGTKAGQSGNFGAWLIALKNAASTGAPRQMMHYSRQRRT